MRTDDKHLRKCPTCLTPVDSASLGLRDYATWLTDSLPSKVGGSDIDFVLEQSRTGRVLMLEMKPEGAYLPTGQKILLKRMVNAGFDVWVCWEYKDGSVEVGYMDRKGGILIVEKTDKQGLQEKVAEWWKEGFDDE